MPEYYSKIDVYVCTSKIEGTPNPVLEAMACGVPVISTDVGVIPELFGPLQQEFILRERSVPALMNTLLHSRREPHLLAALSAENLETTKAWSWPEKAAAFKPFFEAMLERRHALQR